MLNDEVLKAPFVMFNYLPICIDLKKILVGYVLANYIITVLKTYVLSETEKKPRTITKLITIYTFLRNQNR